MKESTRTLIDLINNNFTLNDIASTLNLTHKQLYYRLVLLKNQGYFFKKNYYSNGEITFSMLDSKDLNNYLYYNNNINIITKKNDNNLRLIVISDLHLGAKNDNIEALYKIYEYAKSNNIHSIINCGDLVDGIGGRDGAPKEKDLSKQIDYLIKNYPFDKNILNYTILGNHDVMSLYHTGVELKQVLENKRLDIIPLGYNQSIIKIKNSKIGLSHPIEDIKKRDWDIDLNLIGHSHTAKFTFSPHTIMYVPSLSNINMHNENRIYYPQALDITLHFNTSNLANITGYQLILLNNNFHIVNDFNSQIKSSNPYQNNVVENLPVSKFVNNDSTEKNKVRTRQSQIDKFKQKYGQFL